MVRARPRCFGRELVEPSPADSVRTAEIAKALAHPARLAMLERFDGCTPHPASELAAGLSLAPSTVFEHLRVLRDAGVVATRHEGNRVWYCLRPSVLAHFAGSVQALAGESVATTSD